MIPVLDIFAPLFPVVELSQDERTALEQVAPEEATAFIRCVYRECKGSPHTKPLLKEICSTAARSGGTVSEYVRDIIAVYQWIEARQGVAYAADVLEYVRCAREGSSLQVGHSIQWYLETYGFEKVRPV